jgi:predicted DCC family thiol-disulfide oxidoreductase YuxK
MAAIPSTPRLDPAAPESLAARLASLPPRIVFFDGVCAFCDGTVKWLIEHDPDARLHFAPLQGETAALVRSAFPGRFPSDIDTLVYLEPGDEAFGRKLSLRSDALFAVADEIGGDLRWVSRWRWLPRWLADLAYRAFAATRYRVFGVLDACEIPTPRDRARLLA